MWYTSSIHSFPKYQKFRDARYSPPRRKDPCQPSRSSRFHRSMGQFPQSIRGRGAAKRRHGGRAGWLWRKRPRGDRAPWNAGAARAGCPVSASTPSGIRLYLRLGGGPCRYFRVAPVIRPGWHLPGGGPKPGAMFPGPNSGEGRTPRRSGLRSAKPRPFVVWAIDARPQVVSRKLTRALEGPVLSRDVDTAPAKFRRMLPRCSTPATCGWSGTPNTTEWN